MTLAHPSHAAPQETRPGWQGGQETLKEWMLVGVTSKPIFHNLGIDTMQAM